MRNPSIDHLAPCGLSATAGAEQFRYPVVGKHRERAAPIIKGGASRAYTRFPRCAFGLRTRHP